MDACFSDVSIKVDDFGDVFNGLRQTLSQDLLNVILVGPEDLYEHIFIVPVQHQRVGTDTYVLDDAGPILTQMDLSEVKILHPLRQ